MIHVVLKRSIFSDQGTFGHLTVYVYDQPVLNLFTGELPWRDNKTGISCIPEATYECAPYSSRKYPNHYQVKNVPNRVAILIHEGNFCGDRSKNYLTNVQGCILLGTALGTIKGQKAVLSSKIALDKFRKVVGKNSFSLEIL